jgi:hypothetical protein
MLPLCGRNADDKLVMNFTLLGVSLNVINSVISSFHGWRGFRSLGVIVGVLPQANGPVLTNGASACGLHEILL